MKIQLSELNLTYVLGWYGTCDNNQEFDLNTISSSISSVLQIAEDNHTWKSFDPANYSSDFDRLVAGHIYYFTFNRGTNEVEIPDLVKTNYSDTPMSQQRITDQCGGNFSDVPDFGSDSGATQPVTPSPMYGDTGQTPYTETPISISEICCGDMENSYALVSGQRFETPTGESLVSQHNGTLCFNNISADMNGNTVLYYVSFSQVADEVHLEITLQTSNQINNVFSFTTDDGSCFTGTLDYMTPTINRFTQVVFPTPTPNDLSMNPDNPDFGSDTDTDDSDSSTGGNYFTPKPTPLPVVFFPTPTPNPVDATFNPIIDNNYDEGTTGDSDVEDVDADYSEDIDEEYNPPFGPVDNTDSVEDDDVATDDDIDHNAMDEDHDAMDLDDDTEGFADYDDEDNVDSVVEVVAPYEDQVHQMHKERMSVLTNFQSYSFDFKWTGDVPLESLNNVTIHVENNLISEITSGDVNINPTTTPREYYTMDMLFLYVENEIARNPDVANISYHEEIGYITSFELDMSTDQEFDKVGFLVSNFNVGDNNNMDDMQVTPDLGDIDDDQWDEETSYYEEGEVPFSDEYDTTTDSIDSPSADPISEIPEEMSSDSTDSTESDDSDFVLNDEVDYGLDDTDDMHDLEPDYTTDDMHDLEPDVLEGNYTDDVSDSDEQVESVENTDFSELPMDGYNSDYDMENINGVSDSVEQVESMEGTDISELPMDGYALDDISTTADGYLNPLPNNNDIFNASEENTYEDLNTLE